MADPPRSGDATDGEILAGFAGRVRAADGAASGACPDPGLVAGLAEGRLLDFEADEVVAHVESCAACRTLVAELVRGGPAYGFPSARPRATRRRPALRWAVALAAAAGIVAAVTLFGAGHPRDTRETVLASARELAWARPDLFAGFVPLSSGRSAPPSPTRGALALLAPAGTVLDARPGFRWEEVPGVTRWTVTLKTAEGDPVWSAESGEPSLAFPASRAALAPGIRYIFEVHGTGPLGAEDAQRAFDVAGDGERRAFEESAREVERRVPQRVRRLVLAQVALHRGLYAVAQTEAERYVREAPGDAFGAETLAAVRRAIGEPAAGGR
jgi:hypothetical protein